MPHVIAATISIGGAKEENVVIPRISTVFNTMSFEFKHLYFRVHLAFTMSINKAQTQSLRAAGINLGTSFFSSWSVLRRMFKNRS